MVKPAAAPRSRPVAGERTIAQEPPARRGDLDVLRVLVVVGLVFFHSAVIFGPGEFPVKADTEQRLATVFLAFGATWGMPLLFVISGMGVWYSLQSRSATAFVRERLRRLGVPLLVGLLTLVPLQVYLGLRRTGDPGASTGFHARYWDVRPALDFPFVLRADPDGGLFETGHLWFLVCLLGFSLVLLPGLVLLRRPRGRWLVERVGGLLGRPGGILLPAVPLAAVEVLLGSEAGLGAWNKASYALTRQLALRGDTVVLTARDLDKAERARDPRHSAHHETSGTSPLHWSSPCRLWRWSPSCSPRTSW